MDGGATSTSTATGGKVAGVSKGLSCNTCSVSFSQNEEQKTHMRSEWHVYNLKRNIASLPPLSQKVFKERLGNERIKEEGANQETSSFFKKCPGCEKGFYSLKAWGNHVEKSRCMKEIEFEFELEGGMSGLALGQSYQDAGDKEDVDENDSETDLLGDKMPYGSRTGYFLPMSNIGRK